MTITAKEYGLFDEAYKFFNAELWNNQLPDCLIVLSTKGGRKNLGIFSPGLIAHRSNNEVVDEITLNIANFLNRTDKDIISTLVHEMAHLWQQHNSKHKPSKYGYHDKTWGNEMKRIGLHPSNTGAEGGKETGRQMTHYFIDGGMFEIAFEKWIKTNALNWQSLEFTFGKKEKKKTSFKYVCPECGQKFSGKAGLHVVCGDCEGEIAFECEE